MDKLKQAKKLLTLQQEPYLALFDEIVAVSDKLKGIQGVLKSINSKEAQSYNSELETLIEGISGLTMALNDKDMSVNVEVSIDKLESSINAVEKAIKDIKIDIPKQDSELKLSDAQINAILLEIQAIPPFPYKELEMIIKSVESKLVDHFDYDRLDKMFEPIIKAIKGISISYRGGGGGIGAETYDNGVNRIVSSINSNVDYVSGMGDDISSATYYYCGLILPGTTKWRIQRINKTDFTSTWASGDSNLTTAWANRVSQTYTIGLN